MESDRSRVGLIVGISLALIAALVVAVVVLLNRDTDDSSVAPTPTVSVDPTATAPPTPAEPDETPDEQDEAPAEPEETPPGPRGEPEDTSGTGLPGASLGPFTGGVAPGEDGTWIADVRSAAQSGFDRVVVEFTDVVPTYEVAYADPPFVATNDEEVDVDGEAFLRVRLEGTSSFDLVDGVPVYEGPPRVTSDTDVVTEVVDVDDFEALVIWVIGLTEQKPFVVSELTSPARLVIDVEH